MSNPPPLDAYISRKIRNLSLVCSALVILLHSNVYGPRVQGAACDVWDANNVIPALFSIGISRIAVPFFFICSGFLLFRDFEWSFKWTARKFKSRFHTLLIPYICWCLFGVICFTLYHVACNVLRHQPMAENTVLDRHAVVAQSLSFFGLTEGQPSFHLWYVRRLIEFVLLSPIIGFLLNKLKQSFVLLLLGFVLSSAFVPDDWIAYRTCFDLPILCFSIGGYLGIRNASLSVNMAPATQIIMACAWAVVVVLYTVLVLAKLPSCFASLLYVACCLSGIAVVWVLYDLFERHFGFFLEKWNRFPFFIYCFHIPLLNFTKQTMSRCGMCGLPLYFGGFAVTFLAAVLVGQMCSIRMPRLYGLLTGGR